MLNQRCWRCVSEVIRPSRVTVCRSQLPTQPRPYATIARESPPVDVQQTSKVAKTATELDSLAVSKRIEAQEPKQKRKNYPPNVVASYLAPIKHEAKHRIPVASLQLRSYSVRNLEFFADFALRVASYLNLPASGPVPLPKKIERWTVIRSNFIFKKSQENFERITLKRLVTVYDGAPEVVEIWLAALRKWQFYGVGMKANVWEFSSLDVAANMDKTAEQVQKELDAKLANFGWANSVAGQKSIQDMFLKQGLRRAGMPHMAVRDDIKDAQNVDRIS